MAVVQTFGEPPKIGKTIFEKRGWTEKSRTALKNIVAPKRVLLSKPPCSCSSSHGARVARSSGGFGDDTSGIDNWSPN